LPTEVDGTMHERHTPPQHRPPRALHLVAALALAGCSIVAGEPEATPPPRPVVTIYGSERKNELALLSQSMAGFSNEHGIQVEVTGDDRFESEIDRRVREGSAPDIALFPQPSKIRQHAPAIASLRDIEGELQANFDADVWLAHVTVGDDLKAVPLKSDLKNLVWYSPPVFARLGHKVPKTYDDFLALINEAVNRGQTPLCVGLESGVASGWPFTDWVEDAILRSMGADYYSRWVTHAIPFDDPGAVSAARSVRDLWARPGVVKDGFGGAVNRKVYETGQAVLDGQCLMYRQANFLAAYWPAGTAIGEDGQVDAFSLPGGSTPAEPRPTVSGGSFAAAFNTRPETMKVMRHLASTRFANERARFSGVLSPNRNVDASLYPTTLEQNFAKILKNGCPVRFDGSDLMPPAVGSGTFWQAALDIMNGKDVGTAFHEVERSWPKGVESAPLPGTVNCPTRASAEHSRPMSSMYET
jgi:alpha-glucoside transport system substrate-binding protein